MFMCLFVAALIGLESAAVPALNVSIRTDNHDDFEAGSPRVLACIVFGCAPSSPIVTWYLGDTMLKPNVYKEVNRGNYTVSSLTFVPSLSDNGKELVCKVTNEFMAETFEDKVTVTVGHRPTCVNSGFQSIEAVEGESETILCRVNSDPEPEQFIWTFADGRTIYTTSKKVTGRDTQYSTTLVWVVRADDFGPLFCRASNRFGEQKQPCTFSVIKSGQPTTPKCNMSGEDQESLKVKCEKSLDNKSALITTPAPDSTYNHPEDMPPNPLVHSVPRTPLIQIIIGCIILIMATCIGYTFIKALLSILARFRHREAERAIRLAGASSVGRAHRSNEQMIPMHTMPGYGRSPNTAQRSNNREFATSGSACPRHNFQSGGGPFLEQQAFHV